jgi:hypothetical protein
VTRCAEPSSNAFQLTVARFPAQEQVNGSSKIPTVLYYDADGHVRAIGAEALSEGIYEQAEDEGWFKVEW